MRVMLDPGILVGYLLLPSDPGLSIVNAALVGAYSLLIPEHLLDQLSKMIAEKEKVGALFAPPHPAGFLHDLKVAAVMVPELAHEIRSLTRNMKSDYLVACAVEGKAEIVVSTDPNLRLLGRAGELSFIGPADFLRFLSIAS